MKNRRASKRITMEKKIDAIITYNDTLREARRCSISDMSNNGMFLETKTVLEKDAYVNMKVSSEELLGKPLWVQGLVVRTESTGMAIAFTHADDEDITTLLSHDPYS
ncbi:MAG TPA: PilZ domain-containing protein [Deltaproteobacteria bacterium]|nr:PilZ domain-containing protein [Deltaproteobacteria bacterium]HPJ95162.1 PilZ domain-containing protein [Deltaproteobacteria bacterium]HPR53266.1 PilZ domain-containing protein [Deltaproteobacteria bacterium]